MFPHISQKTSQWDVEAPETLESFGSFKVSASVSEAATSRLGSEGLVHIPGVCILPGKTILEMIYTVLGGTLNPTYSLTFLLTKINPGPLWKIFQNFFIAHKWLNIMPVHYQHHNFKSRGLQVIREQSKQKKWFSFEPMKKCVIFKDIFPGLSSDTVILPIFSFWLKYKIAHICSNYQKIMNGLCWQL